MAIRNLLILFATFSKAAKIIKNRKFSYHGFWLQVSVSDSVEMKKAGISDHRIWLQVSVMLWKWKKQELSWSHILVASFSDGVEMKKSRNFPDHGFWLQISVLRVAKKTTELQQKNPLFYNKPWRFKSS